LISFQSSTLFHVLYSFLFNAPAPTEIYTLSLHDALPISLGEHHAQTIFRRSKCTLRFCHFVQNRHANAPGLLRCFEQNLLPAHRSEEHTSELQSRGHLVCRLLLEKKKKKQSHYLPINKHW